MTMAYVEPQHKRILHWQVSYALDVHQEVRRGGWGVLTGQSSAARFLLEALAAGTETIKFGGIQKRASFTLQTHTHTHPHTRQHDIMLSTGPTFGANKPGQQV